MTPRNITIIPIRQAGFAEPTLEEILSDPITQAVMQADAVDAGQLELCFTTLMKLRAAAQTAAPVFASKKCSRSGLSERRI